VLRNAQLANVTIYSVGLSTTRAELQAKPKDTRPQLTPPGTFPLPPQPGTPQTPTSEANRYGNIDLMALAVWAVQHVHNQIKDHALEVAATATGGVHLATFKDRSIEKAIDDRRRAALGSNQLYCECRRPRYHRWPFQWSDP